MDYYRHRTHRKKLKLTKFLRFSIVTGLFIGVICFLGPLRHLFQGTPVSGLLHRGGPNGDSEASIGSNLRFWAYTEAEGTGGTEATTPVDGLSSAAAVGGDEVEAEPSGGVLATSDLDVEETLKLLGDGLPEPDAEQESSGQEAALADSGESENAVIAAKPLLVDHVVKSGETLWDIARKYQVNLDTVIVANNFVDANRLRIGQKVRVPTQDGVFYHVQRGDSIWKIAQRFNVASTEIISTNGIDDPARLRIGQELFIPGMEAVRASRYVLVGPDGKLRRAFDRPVSGGWISSRFGPRWGRLHAGLDIAVPTGTIVRAAADGIVTFSGSNGGYGLLVRIDHGDGVETRYAHNSRLVVKAGQRVKRGQIIAYSGNTGNSTGPHLHFEIRLRGVAYDPLKYIR